MNTTKYTVPDGYSRLKNPPMITVRDLTREEGLAIGGHAKFIARDGTLRDIKINGAVKTWKRDPDRIEIPCKYGMYEYGTFCWNGSAFITDPNVRLVKVVEEE